MWGKNYYDIRPFVFLHWIIFKNNPMIRVFILFIISLPISPVLADLMINPTRIVLDEKNRNGQLELLNNGEKNITYRISLINRRMDKEGKFSSIDDKTAILSDEKFADRLLRFSPSQITLEPGKSQIIRIALRRFSDLSDGEYRSHLLFEQIPNVEIKTSITTAHQQNDKEEMSIQLTALLSATIPVIVRQGVLDLEILLTDPRFSQKQSEQPATLEVVIHRKGNRSAYGDLVVSFVPDKEERAIVVGRINGIAVYTPNSLRYAKVILNPNNSLILEKGRLIARFFSPISEDAKLLAEVSLQLL